MNTGPGGGATTLSAVDTLRSPATIRERCENIATAIEAGGSPFFTLDPSRLDALAQRVLETMRSHARRNHAPDDARWLGLDAGGVDRMGDLSSRLADAIPAEQTRARVDLAIAVALLDASAGPTWHYEEGASGQCFESTEGLAVAGFRAFMAGVLSSRSDEPLRVDGHALARIDANTLAHVFQAHADNPLPDLEERAATLRRAGEAMMRDAIRFGADARPGGLFTRLGKVGKRQEIGATELCHALLAGLSSVLPGAGAVGGEPLGDAWPHPLAGGEGDSAGWVPFHRLAQAMACSLLGPFEAAGVRVTGTEDLTGLADARNGSLFVDAEVIRLRDPGLDSRPLQIRDPAVVEWRALTVTLMDRLAMRVRALTQLQAGEPSLARIQLDGTWPLAEALARKRRAGAPALAVHTGGLPY
ncbi:MAG: DUF1688 family protein [Burkholderiaceae bacterium]|nr:DUF1688 family protein [Burkholderiaceae bacterium]